METQSTRLPCCRSPTAAKMSSSSDNATAWTPPEGSWASSEANRRAMQGNRSRDTKPELAIRTILHAAGFRYRVHCAPLKSLRRRADIVFGPARVAVFIDGCYWHGCPEHYVPPKTNSSYWNPKIAGNIARDRDTDEKLTAAGWFCASGHTKNRTRALKRSQPWWLRTAHKLSGRRRLANIAAQNRRTP